MADPSQLKYTPEHEWLDVAGDVATVGITGYAADKLGDIVFVELPEVGAEVTLGKVVGEIESTKSVGELFAPVSGSILEANTAAVDQPELVGSDPLGAGWLIKIRFTELPDNLLGYEAYRALTGQQETTQP